MAILDAFLRSSGKLTKSEVEAAGAASILMAAKNHGYKITSLQVSKFPLFADAGLTKEIIEHFET